MGYIKLKTTDPRKSVLADYSMGRYFAGVGYYDDERPTLTIGEWKTLRGVKQGLNKKMKQKYGIELNDDIEKLNALQP